MQCNSSFPLAHLVWSGLQILDIMVSTFTFNGHSLTGVTPIGIKVTAGTQYKVSFFYRFPISSSFMGTLTVGLQTLEGQVLAASQVPVYGSQTSWKNVNAILIPTTTPPSTANLFTVTFDGDAAAEQTINFAMLSLFPPTFKDRPNGMRLDIAQVCLCAL